MRDSLIEVVQIASKITSLWNKFSLCKKLEKANLSNVSNIILGNTFQDCSGLKEVIFKEGNKTIGNINSAFYGCTKLESVVNFNNVTTYDMQFTSAFQSCTSLTSLDLSNWNISTIKSMSKMFYDCSKLTTITGIENWNTENVTNMSEMFRGCSSLTSLDLSNWDVGNVTTLKAMFSGCTSLTSVNAEGLDTRNASYISEMFKGCTSLTSVDLSGWVVGNASMYGIFHTCTSLTSLNVENWDTGNANNMGAMFYNCSSLTSLDLSSLDVGNVTDMFAMFQGCSSLTSLDLSSWNTENVTTMANMFRDCPLLQNLDVSHFKTGKVTTFFSTFEGCKLLTDFNFLNNWDIGSATNISAMLYNSGITGTFTLNWDLSNVVRMTGFLGGTTITDLNLRLTSNKANITFDSFANSTRLANWDGVDVSIISKRDPNGIQSLFTHIGHSDFVNKGNVNINFYGTITRDMDIWNFLIYGLSENGGVLRALSVDSIVNLLELLEDYTGQDTATLNLGSYTIARLSAEQIRIATDKNWTLI